VEEHTCVGYATSCEGMWSDMATEDISKTLFLWYQSSRFCKIGLQMLCVNKLRINASSLEHFCISVENEVPIQCAEFTHLPLNVSTNLILYLWLLRFWLIYEGNSKSKGNLRIKRVPPAIAANRA
jgi:hypothetical protein